jgi:hypothetical protein
VMVRQALKIGLKLCREKAERFVTGEQQGQDRLPRNRSTSKKARRGNFPRRAWIDLTLLEFKIQIRLE